VLRISAYSSGIPHAVNICMRTTTCSTLALSITLLAAAPVSLLAATPEHAVTPSIVPLAVARSLILRNMPGWRFDSSQISVFDVVTRRITEVSVPVACEATKTCQLEIPFALGTRELAIDAAASFVDPRSLHLGDVTVLSLRDRIVKLGFTMTGVPLPPFSATCTPGQALVSVRVNLLTWARPH
jgi:hypothetical protein